MRGLNDVSELWRDYLYANEDNFNSPKDFLISLQLISDSHEQLLETMLKEEPDMDLVAECKLEIEFQREGLVEVISSFIEYYHDNGSSGRLLDKDELLNELCSDGVNHFMYEVAEDWQCWGERVHRIWEMLSDRYGNGLHYIHDDLCKLVLKEVYDSKTKGE